MNLPAVGDGVLGSDVPYRSAGHRTTRPTECSRILADSIERNTNERRQGWSLQIYQALRIYKEKTLGFLEVPWSTFLDLHRSNPMLAFRVQHWSTR